MLTTNRFRRKLDNFTPSYCCYGIMSDDPKRPCPEHRRIVSNLRPMVHVFRPASGKGPRQPGSDLEALIAQKSIKRLAKLGATEKQLRCPRPGPKGDRTLRRIRPPEFPPGGLCRRTDDRRWRTEDGWRRAETREWRVEDRRGSSEDRRPRVRRVGDVGAQTPYFTFGAPCSTHAAGSASVLLESCRVVWKLCERDFLAWQGQIADSDDIRNAVPPRGNDRPKRWKATGCPPNSRRFVRPCA
jgi:hypothetical protein